MSPRVCLAISAYRSDESVLRLLEAALALPTPPFHHVLVVDSLSSGVVPAELKRRGWSDRVEYRSFDFNLGSAGNLARRLSIPTEQGFDYVYAINHDGQVAPDIISALLAHAQTSDRIGAAYPLRRYSRRGNKFDLTGLTRYPVPAIAVSKAPREDVVRVFWASSNGALYATRPIREGLRVLDELWLGFEDLAYGWSLDAAGYEQHLVTAAILDDDYEYRPSPVGTMSQKPTWYSYYVLRNLILAARRTQQGPAMTACIAARSLLELGLTATLRDNKTRRLSLLARGVVDGMLDRAGKGPVP